MSIEANPAGRPQTSRAGNSSQSRPRVLLTNAEERSVLAAARSLHRAGYEVACGSHTRLAPGQWSRACKWRPHIPRPHGDAEPFVQGLRRELERQPYDILLPGSDSALLAISRRRGELESLTKIGLPAEEIVERSLSREYLTAAAAQLSMPTPVSIHCEGRDEIVATARRIGFPIVLKSLAGAQLSNGAVTGAPKARMVRDEADLLKLATMCTADCLVQRWEAGDLLSCGGVIAGGRLLGLVAARYLRMWPPDGGSVAFGETISITPELEESALRLTHAIGWQGIFELEFIETVSGGLMPIDLNPRPYGSMALASAAGAPLAPLWADWLRGDNPEPVHARAGLRYRWEDGDIRHLVTQLARGNYRSAALVALPHRRVTHAHFELSDPLPLAMRGAHLAQKAMQASTSKP